MKACKDFQQIIVIGTIHSAVKQGRAKNGNITTYFGLRCRRLHRDHTNSFLCYAFGEDARNIYARCSKGVRILVRGTMELFRGKDGEADRYCLFVNDWAWQADEYKDTLSNDRTYATDEEIGL